MYCPNLECPDFKATGSPGEYIEGITVCPYCGTTLVKQAPIVKTSEGYGEGERHRGVNSDFDEELVEVATHYLSHDADLMKSLLVSQGIDVFEFGTDLALGCGTGVRLMVPRNQAEQAIALIRKVENDS